MADKRISQLVDRGTVANSDVVPIVVSGAVTTNKATISSIQTFMQGNLDLGVTSVGITLGTTGTDVSVSGSPITSSGNITINIPTASATNRGALSSADWSTFNSKQGAITLTTTGTSGVSTLVGNTLNIPNYSTDLSGYVTLGTSQTITAQKTFTTSGSSDTMIISHGSGSGFALDVIKAGSGEAIRVQKTSGSGNAMTISGGNFEAPTIVKTGGTSSQFLKADGSVDSSTYLTTGTAASTYVPYTGAGANVDLGVYNITSSAVNVNGSGSNAGVINLESNTIFPLVNGYGTIGSGTTNQFNFYQTTGAGVFRGAILSLNSITASATRTYTLPDADGTLALSGDLGSYLPLAGGTLTGALNGTSAVFTSAPSIGGSQVQALSNSGASTSFGVVLVQSVNGKAGYLTCGDNSATTWYGGQASFVTLGATLGAGIKFRVDADDTKGITIPTSGNVGIGTATLANERLTVVQTTGNASALYVRTSAVTTGQSYGLTIEAGTNSSDASFRVFNQAGTTQYFGVRGDGNVGIGTASPAQILDVRKATASGDTQFNFVNSQNSSSGNTSVTSSIYLGFCDDGGGLANVNKIVSGKSGDYTSAPTANSFLAFHTTGANSLTERMRITSGGFTKARANGTGYFNGGYHELLNNNNVSGDRCLVIGNNAGSNTNNTSSFTFIVADAGNDRLIIYGNGNVVNQNNSYGSLSDIKLKENIEDASPKLDDLLKVKVRNYNLIGEDTKQIGVIAQELEEVFPSMIDESEDFEEVEVPQLDEEGNEVINEEGEVVTTKERLSKGTTTKSVKYSVFVPMLIKAIQEQQEQIQELKTEIDSLKNQIK